jgi:hypothetical protein
VDAKGIVVTNDGLPAAVLPVKALLELCAAGRGHGVPFSDCSSGELRPCRVHTVVEAVRGPGE